MRLLPPLLCCMLFIAPIPAPAQDDEPVDLIPQEAAPLGLESIWIALTTVVGGWSYWRAERIVTVETVPADAEVSIYYIRSNFQKRFERSPSPLSVRLPHRANTTARDRVKFLVVANGYSEAEMSYPSREVPDHVVIQLEPLPNSLTFLGHTYIAGRTSLVLRTSEEPQFRVSRKNGSGAIVLSLTETADKLELRPQVSVGEVESINVNQIGEDVLIHIATRQEQVEARSKQSYDPIRKQHVFVLDIMAQGVQAPSPQDVSRALARVPYTLSDPCHRRSEQALRDRLDPAGLTRAFRPSGTLADLYRREAMLRLGRLDGGRVQTLGGESLRTGHPVELQLALQKAHEVRGYLGLISAFARTQDAPLDVLRSLLSPEMSSDAFREIHVGSEDAWKNCHG